VELNRAAAAVIAAAAIIAVAVIIFGGTSGKRKTNNQQQYGSQIPFHNFSPYKSKAATVFYFTAPGAPGKVRVAP
jgi:hypothetical protein